MVNSIRDNLTETDTISELRLLLPAQKDCTFILVEGPDDLQLFTPLLHEKVELIKSYGSKNGIEHIIMDHFKRNKRVIGIRDKDYQKKSQSNRIFFCDFCCAEMMIVANINSFNRVYANFYKGTLTPADLRLYCLSHLEFLSNIRKLNELHSWRIRLDGIKSNSLFDDNISRMNTKIVSEINAQNPSNQLDALRLAQITAQPQCVSLSDYLLITNGHDFVRIFSKLCKNCSIDAIESSLRCAFSSMEFKTTNLYSNLYAYEQKHNLHIVAA